MCWEVERSRTPEGILRLRARWRENCQRMAPVAAMVGDNQVSCTFVCDGFHLTNLPSACVDWCTCVKDLRCLIDHMKVLWIAEGIMDNYIDCMQSLVLDWSGGLTLQIVLCFLTRLTCLEGCMMHHINPSLVPRPLCRGGGKRDWYTLFAHAPSSLGTCILLRYTKIMVNSVYLLKGHTAQLYSL